MNTKENTAFDVLHGNANNTNSTDSSTKGEKLFDIIELENNPLKIVAKDGEHYVVLGTHRLNENAYITLEEAKKDAERNDVERILQLSGIMHELLTQYK